MSQPQKYNFESPRTHILIFFAGVPQNEDPNAQPPTHHHTNSPKLRLKKRIKELKIEKKTS